MSPTFYPRPDYVASVVGSCVEVCLRRISRDSVSPGLQLIYLDSVFVRLHLGVTGLILLIYDFLHRLWLLLWCVGPMGPSHDDFSTTYYNKVSPTLVREGR